MVEDENQRNPKVWKWGIFCYDPYDPEPITYKSTGIRSGILTLNFAHKLAYVYLIGLITLIPLAILIGSGIIHV